MARKRKKDNKANNAVLPVMRPDAAGIDIGATEIFVAVPTDSLPPGPLPNSTTLLIVDGTEYRLRDARAEADSDGAVTYLFCEAV